MRNDRGNASESSHTRMQKKPTAVCVFIFGPCGESGHLDLGGNSKLVTRSFLSQTK